MTSALHRVVPVPGRNGQLTPTVANVDFYQQYFFGRGNEGLRDYYADVTHGHTNLVGDVFGWLDIGHTLAEHGAVTGQAQRRQALDWGLAAANAAGIQVDAYRASGRCRKHSEHRLGRRQPRALDVAARCCHCDLGPRRECTSSATCWA